jgi:hypothetical protein
VNIISDIRIDVNGCYAVINFYLIPENFIVFMHTLLLVYIFGYLKTYTLFFHVIETSISSFARLQQVISS